MPEGRRLLGNAAVSAALQFGSSLVVLGLTPLVLAHVGLGAYGLWALLMTIARYSLVADFGIGPSVTKYVAEHWSRGDRAGVRGALTIGTLYYLASSAIVVTVAVVFGGAILALAKMSVELHRSAPGMLVWFAAYFAFNTIAWSSSAATLAGLGLLRVAALANACGTLAYALTIAIALTHGGGVAGLLVGSFVQVAVSAAIGYVAIGRTCGGTFVAPWSVPRQLVRRMLQFGGWVQISTIAGLLNTETPPLVLAYCTGVETVALYDIASRLARSVRALAYHFNGALLPAISAIEARGDTRRTVVAVEAAHRFMSLWSFAAMGLLLAIAPLVVRVWLGAVPHADLLFIAIAALALVYLVENFVNVAITGLRGQGKPRVEAWFAVTYAACDVTISLALAPHFGLAGVLGGLGVGVFAGAAVFARAAARAGGGAEQSLAGFWVVRLAGATLAATVLTALVVRALEPHALGKVTAFASIAGAAALYACAFVGALHVAQFLRAADLRLARRIAPQRLGPVLDWTVTRKLFGER